MNNQANYPSGNIVKIFWRCITPGDFFNIERRLDAGPQGGGGQLYIDIPLSRTTDRGLYFQDFGVFINGQPFDDADSSWRTFEIQAYSASVPFVVASLVLTPRGGRNSRYRISNQNRQATGGHRHPAWSADRGFPRAPDDVTSKDDSRMPDISFLKVYIARTDTGKFIAGYSNSDAMPPDWPDGVGLEVLFQKNSTKRTDGIIVIDSNLGFLSDYLRNPIIFAKGIDRQTKDVVSVGSIVHHSSGGDSQTNAGKSDKQISPRPRPDLDETMHVQSPQASSAEDWVEYWIRRQYGGQRVWRIGHTELESIPLEDGLLPGADIIVLNSELSDPERFVEVKSSKDSLPQVIHLTASELQRAKRCAIEGLSFDIWVVTLADAGTSAIVIPFELEASVLTIDELATLGLRIRRGDGLPVPPAVQ